MLLLMMMMMRMAFEVKQFHSVFHLQILSKSMISDDFSCWFLNLRLPSLPCRLSKLLILLSFGPRIYP